MIDFVEEGKKVILKERDALDVLAQSINGDFEKAVRLICESNGRLVISGIGKSGHIARKIAATMASVGQKSFFVHPSEASHGDLGMISDDDVILLISNSGESAELFPMIEFAKRRSIKLISISQAPNSTLATNSDISLILPKLEEACPLGLAPTVSSTMTLALGDAMAISTLTLRGFTKEDFKSIHPGGAIGNKLAFVFDIMHKGADIPLVNETDSMQNAVIVMTKHSVGCVGVVNQSGTLSGIITDGDLRRHMSPDVLSLNAQNIMTPNPIVINKNMMCSEVISIMESRKITNIFVVDSYGKPIGAIHIHDLVSRKLI